MRKKSILIVLVFLTVAFPSSATLTGYVGDNYCRIYSTNFETGEQEKWLDSSDIGSLSAFAMDISPIDEMLYLMGNSSMLYKIDTVTGDSEEIGKVPTTVEIESLAFAPNGDLYATRKDSLIQIDPETAGYVEIGYIDVSGYKINLAIDNNGRAIGSTNYRGYYLYEVDLATADTTILGIVKDYDALDFGPNNELYGWYARSQLYQIDIDTITETYLRSFSRTGEAFTVVPEPATLLLLGLGSVVTRRKRRPIF